MNRNIIGTVVTAVALAASAGFAAGIVGSVGASERVESHAGSGVAGAPGIAAQEVIARVEALGYTRIHDMERERGAWEVEAFDAEGRRAKLRIDAGTGEVLESRHRDRYDRD